MVFCYLQVVFVGQRAVGVDLERNGTLLHVRANREVVLASGALGTTEILLRSGVGPSQHLRDMEVSTWRKKT